jgi:predicted nuclease of predicted toxin-antitoxin system
LPLKFYADVHIAKEAVRQLKQRDIDIVHCGEVGMADASDATHLEYAINEQRVVITCDKDFPILHFGYLATGKIHFGIVHLSMNEDCQNIGTIVKEIAELHDLADNVTDLQNVLWRV